MGSYAVGSGGGYSNYSYQLPQSGSQASGLPNQGDGSLQESKSLLSNTDPHANDLPMLGAKDNRVISNKTIQKHLDAGDMVVAMSGGGGHSLDEWLRGNFS